MRSFVSELRRRNVLRVAAFYAVAGWLLVQVAAPTLLACRKDPRFAALRAKLKIALPPEPAI